MSIDDLSKVAGVAGFAISLATFALTRWERRIVLVFGLDSGSSSDFHKDEDEEAGNECEEPRSSVNVTITNIGSRPALLDLRTLEVRSNGNTLRAWHEDHWGGQQREVLLKSGDSHTIGIPLQTFTKQLKIQAPKKYDENSFYFMHPVQVLVRAADGKSHASKRLKYWEATGEFHRNA